MIMTRTLVFRELIHWMLIWTLAAIVIVSLSQRVGGNAPDRIDSEAAEITAVSVSNLDLSDRLKTDHRHPYGPAIHPEKLDAADLTLDNVLRLNAAEDYPCAITVWKELELDHRSAVWKHVGMAAAYLKENDLEKADLHLQVAFEMTPENPVVDYFYGRLLQAKSRDVPFWFDPGEKNLFRFAIMSDREKGDDQVRGRTYLPHFLGEKYAVEAKRHFRRAVDLADKLDLDAPIIVVSGPRVELTAFAFNKAPAVVTVGQLLESLDEADFVEKAERTLGIRLAMTDRGQDLVAVNSVSLLSKPRR